MTIKVQIRNERAVIK